MRFNFSITKSILYSAFNLTKIWNPGQHATKFMREM